ncbi:hypothetical protein [Prevotella sp. HUN102]|uniref:hypothetical protein n=1 Tax=Prevotella sp. HUN102 TaxID=1392486 RepID=UPI000490518E|nr:hypothetical protein [Prevotella sp. HUN102]
MSNKRDLKRTINYICSDLFAEAVAASLYGSNEHQENVDALLSSILIMHANYINRVSHVQPGMKASVYFKDLKNKFNEEVGEIIDQISNLG